MSRPDHHAPPNAASPQLVPMDIFRSVGQVIHFSPPLTSSLLLASSLLFIVSSSYRLYSFAAKPKLLNMAHWSYGWRCQQQQQNSILLLFLPCFSYPLLFSSFSPLFPSRSLSLLLTFPLIPSSLFLIRNQINYAGVFEGSVIGAANTPDALVRGGVRLNFAVAATLMDLSRTWFHSLLNFIYFYIYIFIYLFTSISFNLL